MCRVECFAKIEFYTRRGARAQKVPFKCSVRRGTTTGYGFWALVRVSCAHKNKRPLCCRFIFFKKMHAERRPTNNAGENIAREHVRRGLLAGESCANAWTAPSSSTASVHDAPEDVQRGAHSGTLKYIQLWPTSVLGWRHSEANGLS